MKSRTQHLREASHSWPQPDKQGDTAACLFCDTIHDLVDIQEGEAAYCKRCGNIIYQNRRASLVRATCFSVSALIFMLVVQFLPFLTLNAAGLQRELTLINTTTSLMRTDAPILGASVLVFTILAPFFLICGMLYSTTPLLAGRCAPGAEYVVKWVYRAEPWNMVEVFLLGVLVSILKLAQVADVHINAGFWAYAGAMLCTAAAIAGIDRRELWDRLELANES